MNASSTARIKEKLARGETIDLRGDGKAGGGLVLAMQAFGAVVSRDPELDTQDWPLFSSARKGANVRAFMRIARGEVQMVCQVVRPDISLLMNEAAAAEIDFAEGTSGAIYVLNTASSPEEAAERYRLGGMIVTVAGDELGRKHLGRPLGNVAVLAALVRASGIVGSDAARECLLAGLHKRRIPDRIVAANGQLFDEALDRVHFCERSADETTSHVRPAFAGYGILPAGAQAALRSSVTNRTAGYGRPGVRIDFQDDAARCNGCSLCVVQCPEGIIDFVADPTRGTLVHGARFGEFCKACRECIAACPLDLFSESEIVARPVEGVEGG